MIDVQEHPGSIRRGDSPKDPQHVDGILRFWQAADPDERELYVEGDLLQEFACSGWDAVADPGPPGGVRPWCSVWCRTDRLVNYPTAQAGGFLLQRALPEIRSYLLSIGVYVRVVPTLRYRNGPSFTGGPAFPPNWLLVKVPGLLQYICSFLCALYPRT